jgi:hypothetical protein
MASTNATTKGTTNGSAKSLRANFFIRRVFLQIDRLWCNRARSHVGSSPWLRARNDKRPARANTALRSVRLRADELSGWCCKTGLRAFL